MDGLTIRYRRRRLGLTQQDLGDLLDVDQGTVSRWERDIEKPRPRRFAALQGILGPASNTRFMARSLALVRNDVLPATLTDARLVLFDGSRKAVRHYAERGHRLDNMIGTRFEEWADHIGVPELIDGVHDTDFRHGGVHYLRFTLNWAGRAHTTVMEPLFDGGEYAGAIQYVTSYFDLPDNGTLSLEQVDMMPSNPDARPVILLRGPNANLVP